MTGATHSHPLHRHSLTLSLSRAHTHAPWRAQAYCEGLRRRAKRREVREKAVLREMDDKSYCCAPKPQVRATCIDDGCSGESFPCPLVPFPTLSFSPDPQQEGGLSEQVVVISSRCEGWRKPTGSRRSVVSGGAGGTSADPGRNSLC